MNKVFAFFHKIKRLELNDSEVRRPELLLGLHESIQLIANPVRSI